MKIYIPRPHENWICDRFTEEWEHYNPELVSKNPHEADTIWLLSPWVWTQLPHSLLKNKKVITTIHHIDETKLSNQELHNFIVRDHITDLYHSPCEKTTKQIKKYSYKKVITQPFWVNQDIWFELEKTNTRKELGLDLNTYFVGSFQRDTEGSDLVSPKLSKGPDIFCDIVEKIKEKGINVEVILAGWRRQYVISRLESAGIKYHYYESAGFSLLNKLYNSLDLYIVSSRCEGGPQSIVECAITKTPIVSTDVGLASDILSSKSIYNAVGDFFKSKADVKYAYDNVQKYLIPQGLKYFKEGVMNVKV